MNYIPCLQIILQYQAYVLITLFRKFQYLIDQINGHWSSRGMALEIKEHKLTSS